jgi:heme oxygenase (biliverdin-IX-beta and delta-forming)
LILNLTLLREETRRDHEQVEDTMPVMRTDLDRDLYAAVLTRLLGLVKAWEQAAQCSVPERWSRLVAERERTALLQQDLADLGKADVDVPRPQLPDFPDAAEVMGAMYVMEGSRLGGQLIARHVDSVLGLQDGRGSRYFRGFGDQTGARWREFAALLANEIPDAQTAAVIRGAKKMFSAFGAWMRGLEVLSH